MERKREECIGYFIRENLLEGTIRSVEHDFLLLSSNRNKFSLHGNGVLDSNLFDYRTYLELDSGIIEMLYFAVTTPHVLEEAGIDLGISCNSVEDLFEKYELIITNRYSNNNLIEKMNFAEKGILALHSVAMRMKVEDDTEGQSVDCLINIPSFSSFSTKDLEDIQRGYLLLAQKCGYPALIQNLTCAFSHFSGLIKDRVSGNGIISSDDLYQAIRFYGVGHPNGNSTTLRHQLEAGGVLNRLFSPDWPITQY